MDVSFIAGQNRNTLRNIDPLQNIDKLYPMLPFVNTSSVFSSIYLSYCVRLFRIQLVLKRKRIENFNFASHWLFTQK
jgi:hypothetical protein